MTKSKKDKPFKIVCLKKCLLTPLTVALVGLLGAFIFNYYQTQQRHIHHDVEKKLESVRGMLEKRLDSDAKLMIEALNILFESQQMQEAWLAKDRDLLLKVTSPLLAKLHVLYEITHFYFHDLGRLNFLRVHKPEKYGDSINRYSILEAIKTGQPSYGVELGPLGTYTLRVVYPWRINGELTGYVEIGKEVERIMRELHDILGIELFVAIHKRNLDRKEWEGGMKMLGREAEWDQFDTSVLVSQTMKIVPPNLGFFISEENHEPMEMSTGLKFSLDGIHYQGGFVPFYDSSDEEIGEIVILDDVTDKIAHSRRSIIIISIICAVVGVVLFVLFYIILGRVEGELAKHRIHLQEMVEERTIELTKANEELHTLSAHLQSVREDERTNVAREIHDELGQILTGLQIDFSNMSMELPKTKKTQIEKIQRMSELIDNSIQTVQRISEDLRPSLLDKLGILPALEWHAEEFQDHMGIKCAVMSNTEDLVLDKDRSTVIFRIFQESLTNVARHANATTVRTDLIKENGSLILKIIDDGKGMTEKEIFSPKSFGIIGMRERTNFVNGELKINSVRGKGTTVTVSMPL